jgi:hypothetical protein
MELTMRIFLTILIIIAVYVGYEAFFNHGSWNYKLTLVVETPEGQVVGSAVRKVSAERDPIILQWLPSLTYGHAGVKGEAVVVDLGQRGVLFALLKANNEGNGDAENIVFREFPFHWKDDTGQNQIGGSELTSEGIRYYRSLKAKKELSLEKLPMLVRFRDIKDPKTVELVDPNDLGKSFGKGVKLVSATLEMTDETVTKGIEKWLSWIRQYYSRRLDSERFGSIEATNRLANDLSSGNFAAGMSLSPYE